LGHRKESQQGVGRGPKKAPWHRPKNMWGMAKKNVLGIGTDHVKLKEGSPPVKTESRLVTVVGCKKKKLIKGEESRQRI